MFAIKHYYPYGTRNFVNKSIIFFGFLIKNTVASSFLILFFIYIFFHYIFFPILYKVKFGSFYKLCSLEIIFQFWGLIGTDKPTAQCPEVQGLNPEKFLKFGFSGH